MAKGTQMRVKPKTLRAIHKVAGMLQSEWGKNATVDDAVWYLLVTAHPEIVGEVEQQEDKETTKPT